MRVHLFSRNITVSAPVSDVSPYRLRTILSDRLNNRTLWFFAGFLLLLIAWKTVLWLHLPLPVGDGVQSLSHTYSILRGDFLHSNFLHHWMEIFQLPYAYGVVTAPLMYVLPFDPLNNYFVASLVFPLVTATITYALLAASPASHSRTFAALTAVLIFLYPNLWSMRPESITVPLLLLTLFVLRPYRQPTHLLPLAGSAFFVVFAGLAHPIGGVIGVLMVTLIALENRWRWKCLFIFYVFTALFLALLYLPLILLDVNLWIKNFIGFFTQEERRGVETLAGIVSTLPRFIAWGLPLLFLYVYALFQSRRQPSMWLLRELAFAALFTIPIVLGGKGAYFMYLLVFILWRLAVLPSAVSVPVPITAVLLIIAPFWTHYFPTFQNLENPRYGETVRAIMTEVDTYSNRTEPGTIWVSTQLGIPIIDEPYARNILNYYAVRRYPQPIPVSDGDEFLYMWASEADIVRDNYALPPGAAQPETLIEPVPGLLTFESLLRERLPDIGLWRITIGRSANLSLNLAVMPGFNLLQASAPETNKSKPIR